MQATITFLKWNPGGGKNSEGPSVETTSQDVFMEIKRSSAVQE